MTRQCRRSRRPAAAPALGALTALGLGLLLGGLATSPASTAQGQKPANAKNASQQGGGFASELLQVPVGNLQPGGVNERPNITNPAANDPQTVQRGMEYFAHMNCVGCHAPNGAGGMGPALSNAKFKFGGEPANIYLTILQGRPGGMPAWGGMLPDKVIWDLVAYIQSISKEPSGEWGKTTSLESFTIEQVPAEFKSTADPWQYTEPFSYGQAPFEKQKGEPSQASAQPSENSK